MIAMSVARMQIFAVLSPESRNVGGTFFLFDPSGMLSYIADRELVGYDLFELFYYRHSAVFTLA